MTNARPLQAILALQPSDGEPAKAQLLQTLASAGVPVTAPRGGNAVAVPPALDPTIVVFDGKLKPEHGALLRSQPHSFLLACPGSERRPHPDDLHILASLLNRVSLVPEFEGVQRYYVATLEGLRAASEQVSAHVESLGAPRSAAGVCADVMYELAANALLDAPAGPDGQPKYAHRRDDPALRISAEDAAVIAFGVKGTRAYLGAVDRFGRLTAEPLAKTLEGLGARAKVNASGGGAGLGMRRMVEQSELVAARVVPGRVTEMLCTVDLGEIRRRAAGPKSLFFSVERG